MSELSNDKDLIADLVKMSDMEWKKAAEEWGLDATNNRESNIFALGFVRGLMYEIAHNEVENQEEAPS